MAGGPTALHSRRVVTPGGVVDATVSIADGVIVGVGEGRRGSAWSCGDHWLIPGLIDTHVHGGGGAQCNTDDPDEVAAVARFHARHGTTGFLATTVSAPVGDLETALRAIDAAVGVPVGSAGGARVLGAHLEGPFLSRARAGAMDPATFLAPDAAVLDRLFVAAGGRVAMMTIAPELPGALALIVALAGSGAVVSLGHSEAAEEEVRAAVRAGARSVTHLFNAMAPFHHRRVGLVGVALDAVELGCELVCDGIHVSGPAMRLALAAKGVGGLRLVTDAIAAAGMGDGSFALGSVGVAVADGVARLPGNETIAGSTLTMDAALGNAVRWLGVSVEQAVALGSATPAALLGLDDRFGAIAPGYAADLAVLDEDLRACGTLVGGRWAGEPPAC